MRSLLDLLILVLTVIAAAIIGFGIPLGWVWIGSQLQGDSGATTLSWSVVMAMMGGIILSYFAVLWLAGLVMARVGDPGAGGGGRPPTARHDWMRGMTDTKTRSNQPSLGGIERLFIITTLIVTAAFWIWFAFFAGSPLPNQ